jgi:hypothetical protein
MAADQLETVVRDFVSQIRDIIRQQAREAVEASFGGAKPGKRVEAARTGRGKGDKRSSDEIEGLQSKFLAFVAKHPGLRIEQINKELGTSTKDLQLPIRKLVAERKIKAHGRKRSTTYSVSGKAAKAAKR